MRHLSLFTGIGGIDLGFERAGMTSAGQVEMDPFCNRVLEKHWPNVPRWEDITELDPEELPDHDIISGGFPCQDISSANTAGRRGLAGDKSGLWSEFARIISETHTDWVVVENVSQWQQWVPVVRAFLDGEGYTSVPLGLPAGAFGAPHKRSRVFVVAHTDSSGEPVRAIYEEASWYRPVPGRESWWANSAPGGVDDGVPGRLDRLRSLGNAVVPQVAEWVGRRIMAVA